jgi:endonuclease YncB( thermonuclease family)
MDAFRSDWDGSLNIAASFLLFLGVALAFVPASPAFADRVVEGAVTVFRDVDTIVVAGVPVRLNGVDGPETSSRVGRDARTFMERLVTGQTVSCVLSGDRTYDRWVGVCYLAGQDIGAIAIANGHALDCPRYSGGRYSSLETPASRSRLPRARYCR